MNFFAARKLCFAIGAVSIAAVTSMPTLAADKAAKAVEDWEIRGEKGSVMTRTPYALLNLTSGKYLSSNIDFHNSKLKWDDEHKPRTLPKPRFEFYKINEKTPSPLKYGDSVVIAMPGTTLFQGKAAPTFLMYKEQEKGINLALVTYSNEQWEVHGGPKGTPVPINAKISLYNTIHKDYVIYAEREHGINLRWNGDVHKPRDHRKKK